MLTKTELIFGNDCPYDNVCQGSAVRILFVCSAGLLRSPTCAKVATEMGFNARSCGSHVKMALVPITATLIEWAQVIVFMNAENSWEAKSVFHQTEYIKAKLLRKSVIWDVPDIYNYNDPDLVADVKWRLEDMKAK